MVAPVPPGVDVQVGQDQGVVGPILGRPLHHRLELGRLRRDSHPGEGSDGPVGQLQGVLGRSLYHVGDHLIAYEDT